MTRIAMRSLGKGAVSFAVPRLRSTHQPGGTASARHCYDLFMRHYGHLSPWLDGMLPKTMAELGPGSSLGVGIAGLMAGIERYIGLDLQVHRNPEHDQQVLAELLPLFQRRADVAERTESGQVFFPLPPDPSFWRGLEARLVRGLTPDSMAAIGRAIRVGDGRLRFVAPWTEEAALPAGSIDWLMSHSVMEHVDSLASTYRSIARWLKPGGFATHLIDFQSHGLTDDWDGHWTVNPAIWALMRGRRPYLINRMWRSHHIELMQQAGFEILEELKWTRGDGAGRISFKAPFQRMPPGDESVAMSFFITRKRS